MAAVLDLGDRVYLISETLTLRHALRNVVLRNRSKFDKRGALHMQDVVLPRDASSLMFEGYVDRASQGEMSQSAQNARNENTRFILSDSI